MAKYKFSKTIKPGEGIVILANGQIEPFTRAAETPKTEMTLYSRHDKAPRQRPSNRRGFSCQSVRKNQGLEKARVEVSPRTQVPPILPRTEVSRCRICGAVVRDFQQHMKTAHDSLSRLSLLSRPRQAVQVHPVEAEIMQGPIETATSSSSINYSSPSRSALLVSSDGIVIGRTASAVCECDKSAVRSQSDGEDSWKGFGFMARDGGRYGSINGEDYAD